MKRISLFLAILLMLTAFAACSDKKKASANLKPEYTFSHQDSTEVLNLVKEFFAYMEKDDIPAAIDMLSILKGEELVPLEPVQKRRQAIALNLVKGVKYDVDYMMFKSDRNNEVKVNITLFEKDENDPKPNMTAFFLRPVRHQGQWFLTAKDNLTDRENDTHVEYEGAEFDKDSEE